MYKTMILSNPDGGIDAIDRMVDEINRDGYKIISFNIQHESPGRMRSFIFILEDPPNLTVQVRGEINDE